MAAAAPWSASHGAKNESQSLVQAPSAKEVPLAKVAAVAPWSESLSVKKKKKTKQELHRPLEGDKSERFGPCTGRVTIAQIGSRK